MKPAETVETRKKKTKDFSTQDPCRAVVSAALLAPLVGSEAISMAEARFSS